MNSFELPMVGLSIFIKICKHMKAIYGLYMMFLWDVLPDFFFFLSLQYLLLFWIFFVFSMNGLAGLAQVLFFFLNKFKTSEIHQLRFPF